MRIYMSILVAILFGISACSTSIPSDVDANQYASHGGNQPEGDFDLAIPDGYCFSTKHSVRTSDTTVVLLHSCNAKAKMGFYSVSALKTESEIYPKEFQQYFQTPQGRQSLGIPANTNVAKITGTKTRNGIFYVEVLNAGSPEIPLTAPKTWRGFFTKDGRLFSITFHPLADQKISSEQSFSALQRYAVKLKNAH
ncbi:hypothetical protein [Paramylibacter kogurei]|nr:hypothetical protein [Amylibacter kogurei]